MKKFVLLILATIQVIGCNQAESTIEPNSFSNVNLIPSGARIVNEIDIDIDGDQQNEKAIHYTEEKTIERVTPFRQHKVAIFAQTNSTWEKTYETPDIEVNQPTPDPDTGVYRATDANSPEFGDIYVDELTGDAGQELIVFVGNFENDWNLENYLIIGEQDGEIISHEFNNGREHIATKLIDFYGRLLSIEISDGTVIEHWGGTCEGSNEPCYTFDIILSYDPETETWTNEATNKEQVAEAWEAWRDNYNPDAVWSDELPF